MYAKFSNSINTSALLLWWCLSSETHKHTLKLLWSVNKTSSIQKIGHHKSAKLICFCHHVKRVVRLKIKIMSLFTHPNVQNPSMKQKWIFWIIIIQSCKLMAAHNDHCIYITIHVFVLNCSAWGFRFGAHYKPNDLIRWTSPTTFGK